MTKFTHYVIRGGVEGRERLRVLSRVLLPTTTALFERVGVRDGLSCLDVGCAGGDVTLELARRVAPHGRVIGLDIDATKLELARAEAADRGIANVRFEQRDVRDESLPVDRVDLVYSRCLLTHLSDPAAAVTAFANHLSPGGTLVVEDIDFSGYFSHPPSAALQRYRDLYCATVMKRGGDPNIGPRLPALLQAAGFQDVGVSVVQPVGLEGEVKLINPLTMENIADTVIEDGLATHDEIAQVVRDLYDFAAEPHTLAGLPRIVQAWGRSPAA